MPRVATIGNIGIFVIPGDHQPPHVHFEGPDDHGRMEIETGNLMAGTDVSGKAARAIRAWLEENRADMLAAWKHYCELED